LQYSSINNQANNERKKEKKGAMTRTKHTVV